MEIQWMLALYSLFMGLSVGPFALLALTDACGKRTNLCKWASLVGLACTILAGIFAFAHLGKPAAAIYVFNNFRSPMTQETLIVLLTGLVAALLAALLLFNWLPGISRKILAWIGLVLAVISVILIAMIYMLPSRPSWNTWLLPLTLLASSIANGLMLAWLLVALVPQEASETDRPKLAEKMRGWALPVLVVYAVLSVIFLLVVASKTGPASTVGIAGYLQHGPEPVGLSRLFTGDLALLFWIGLVVVGLIAPAALAWYTKKEEKIPVLAAFLMVVVGGLVLRVMLFPLGTRIPLTNLW